MKHGDNKDFLRRVKDFKIQNGLDLRMGPALKIPGFSLQKTAFRQLRYMFNRKVNSNDRIILIMRQATIGK